REGLSPESKTKPARFELAGACRLILIFPKSHDFAHDVNTGTRGIFGTAKTARDRRASKQKTPKNPHQFFTRMRSVPPLGWSTSNDPVFRIRSINLREPNVLGSKSEARA